MKTIKILNTELEISRIAFGCMTIGGNWDKKPLEHSTIQNALSAIRAALDEGINFFDHADIYTLGKSEEVFSHIWKESPNLREKLVLQSKCGIRFKGDPNESCPQRYDFSYKHIIYSADNILKRLKTDYLDILLLHRPDPLVEPEEVAKAFDELEQNGKVRYFGVSNHTGAQINLLKKFVRQPLVVNQLEINIIHPDLIEAGIITNQRAPEIQIRGEGTLEYCRLNDIQVQAMAEEKNVSPEAIVLAWVLRHPAMIQPVVGTTKPERIKAACQAENISLTREEWYSLFTTGRGAMVP